MTQSNLDISTQKISGPVECLGQTFESDEARRAHYTELLREKLLDPEFRKIEGFPIGEDEDILNLSDPPYYTACPNPWIGDFIQAYGRPYDPKEKYHREPFAADVSEGKNHPIYSAHSYHTKVPHRAIMRYILHYTNPGDVVFDGFCGTGMTGVAAQLCGDEKEVRELGYRVDPDGTIYNEEGNAFSRLGARRAVLNDLAPVAGLIAARYNDFRVADFQHNEIINKILSVKNPIRAFYEVKSPENQGELDYDFTVWSEFFTCPTCQHELSLFEFAVDPKSYEMKDEFICPNCSNLLTKNDLERVWSSSTALSGTEIDKTPKTLPVLIAASDRKVKLRYEPSPEDLKRSTANLTDYCFQIPEDKFPHGRQTRKVKTGSGISKVSQMYFPRSLAFASNALNEALGQQSRDSRTALFAISSSLVLISRRERFRGGSGKGAQSGTLYVPSLQVEKSPFTVLSRKLRAYGKMPMATSAINSIVNVGSHSDLKFAPSGSVDYIFTDPPFGESLQYGELNFFHEAWLRVFSAISHDCVLNYVHEKDLQFYQMIIRKAFGECYRILKPGRWITVEFSNTGANIWNAIQASLQEVGFVVANVAALDKKQRSFNSVTTTTSVKQDLVISAYKPDAQLEMNFEKHGDSLEGVWDFILSHLKQLPIVKPRAGQLERIAERDPRILYDRMVAFYIGHHTQVPLSSAEFQEKLAEKFPERDGMVFLHEQVAEYDKKAAQMEHTGQMSIFVDDEKSSINWLRQFLKDKPSTYQGLHSEFMQQLSASWKKFESRPELALLLDQNFIKYDGDKPVPSQIHGYLSTNFKDLRNKEKDDAALKAKAKDRWYVPDPKNAIDVEAQREKRLLSEFWEYAVQAGITKRKPGDPNQTPLPIIEPTKKKAKVKKLKEVRTEAIRAGFMLCNKNKDSAAILAVAAILPNNVVEEDEQLQMIVDMAEMRSE